MILNREDRRMIRNMTIALLLAERVKGTWNWYTSGDIEKLAAFIDTLDMKKGDISE